MIDLRSISRRALLVATSSSTFALLQSRFAHAQDLASDAANRSVEISQLAYEIVHLGILPECAYCIDGAINARGQMVGTCLMTDDSRKAGFIWNEGRLKWLADATGQASSTMIPNDINASGVIVGSSFKQEDAPRAFRAEGGAVEELATVNHLPNAVAEAINDDGVIVGWCQGAPSDRESEEPTSAVRWNAGEVARLDDNGASQSHALGINDAGDIVGDAAWNDTSQAVVWLDGRLTILPPFSADLPFDSAVAINNARTVIGRSSNAVFFSRSWIWKPGDEHQTALDQPERIPAVIATAINDAGWIVGTLLDTTGVGKGVLWRDDGSLTRLTDLLPPQSGWEVRAAHDINDRNEIAATVGPVDRRYDGYAAILRPSIQGASTPTP